jgi:hypothetical protein
MDKDLLKIENLIAKRRSTYRKGAVPLEKVPQKTVELGIYLIASSKRIATLKGKRLKTKLEEMQDKIDDFRKVVYKETKKL